MATLEVELVQAFRRRVVDHIRRYFPAVCSRLTVEKLNQGADVLIDDAMRRGLSTERGICLYVNVAIALGRRFESNPSIPWQESIVPRDGENLDPHWIARVAQAAVVVLSRGGAS